MKTKNKYKLITISGIHTQIGITTKINGYTIGIMEVFFPSDEEVKKWSEKKSNKWIDENNKRMEAICNFLNTNKI